MREVIATICFLVAAKMATLGTLVLTIAAIRWCDTWRERLIGPALALSAAVILVVVGLLVRG